MKQTAVEWLLQRFESGDMYNVEDAQFIKNQAKEMEKEQIIESYCQGALDITNDELIFPRETSEEYYNETYNK